MPAAPKPRVHWVSPLPPAATDIAHYTARILPELAEATELALWTDAPDWDRSLERHARVYRLDPDKALPRHFTQAGRGQGRGDTLFIHMGNAWLYHSGFLRLARRIPSVVVLHDVGLQEMCFDAIAYDRLDEAVYRAEMARWYGPEGAGIAERILARDMKAGEAVQRAPGFEIALDKAISVVTHTPTAYRAVTDRQHVPVYQLDLPFRASAGPPPLQRVREGPLRLVQFGYIGPNRRLVEALEVLAALRGEIAFRLDILGKLWNPRLVRRKLHELGLEDRVRIHGFVSEPELDRHLAAAHLVFNLRHPTMGEASGSQLRIWNAAAAAVVTDLGWYRDLPDKTVFKVPLENEKEALAALLRRLWQDRSQGRKVGVAGRALLEECHGPALYAEGIRAVAEAAGGDSRLALSARSLTGAGLRNDLLRRAAARLLGAE